MPRKPQGKRINTADGGVAVRGKAPNGAGSVYPIADGSWRANWTDRSGRRRSVRGRTYAQAVGRRDAAQAADDEATDATRRVPKRFSPRTTTVSDIAVWWLDQQRHRVRPSSLSKYADRIDRFNAILGPELVSELTAEQVASWQSDLLDQLSPSTVADTRSTLVAVLGAAQDLGLVAGNVAQRVKPPRVPKSVGRAITPDEVRSLLAAAASHRLGAAVALLFVQGWRVSEVLGLAWQDVDLEKATAHVAASDPHATTDSQGRYQLTAPAGTYAVHFDGGPTLVPEWYRNAASAATAKPVTVKAGIATSGIDAGLAKAAAPLAVTSVSPAHLGAGQSVSATIRGTGFKSHGVSGLAFTAGPEVTVSITGVVNATTASVRIAAGAAATPGPRDLIGTRDGGSSASCNSCLTVDGATPPAGPAITSISPTPIGPGFLGGLDIKGSGLAGAVAATVDGTGVTVKSLTVLSQTKLRLRVAVDASAQPGQRTLTVSLPGGQQVTSPLTVG